MHVRPVLRILMAAAVVLSACGADASTEASDPPGAAGKSAAMPVVVDYSPTVSDVAALLYLSQDSRIDLLGVTLVGTGESRCGPGVSNTVGLLALVGVGPVPVACGPEQRVGPGHEWPPEWRSASEELAGLSLPTIDHAAQDDAVDLLAALAAAAPEPITIVALGPLTNLAVALERHPAFVDDVAMIYTMGGALDVAGNVPDGLAEWNYYIDPASVAVVLDSGLPVTMIPLDATDHVPMTRQWFESLSDHHTTAAADAVLAMQAEARPFELGFFFWDELAAAVAIDESLVTLEQRPVSIDIEGDAAGRIRDDPAGAVVRVAVDADARRFEAELLTGLNAGVSPPAGDKEAEARAPLPETVSYFDSLAESARVVSRGMEQLFAGPEAAAFDALVGDDPARVLDAEQEATARAFMRAFWLGAAELLQDHRDALATAQVPENLRENHEGMLSATDALIATRDSRLAAIDELEGEALLGFLWSPTPELEEFERACAALQSAADAAGVGVQVCPN